MRRRLRNVALLAVLSGLAGAPAFGGWLVYVGGGVQETKGPWQVKGRQVVFQAPNGNLQSIRVDAVDLAASAFLSWALEPGRRRSEAPLLGGARLPTWKGLPGAVPRGTPCTPARVERVISPETLEVSVGGKRETVHAACLSAPQVQQRFPELSWFGREATSRLSTLLRAGQDVCLVEERPPLRDGLGHRRVLVELAEGRDLTAEAIGRGLGVPSLAPCARGEGYRGLAEQARREERGLWGQDTLDASLAVMANASLLRAGPPPPGFGLGVSTGSG